MDAAQNNVNNTILRHGNEPIWLVKSGDRVLGPFTTEEIKNKIRSKEVVVIDEISAPFSRWRYVRDEPLFGAVVEEIRRGLMHSQENTEVQGYTAARGDTQTNTPTGDAITRADTVTDANLQAALAARTADGTSIQDAEFEDITERNSTAKAGGNKAARQYGVGNAAPHVDRRVFRFASFLWLGVFLVLLAAGYLVLQARGVRLGADGGLSYSAFLKRAEQSWKEGDFETSATFYREANLRKPNQPEIAVRLAVLMLNAGQTVDAKRLLTQVESLSSEAAVNARVSLAMGLAALAGDDYSEALARFRQARIGLERESQWIADFNIGVASFMARRFEDAIDAFRVAGTEPITRLMLARSLIETSGGKENERSAEALAVLESLFSSAADFRQESLVIAAALDESMGRQERARNRVSLAFDTDPDQTRDHFHDPFVASGAFKWTQMVPLCRRLDQAIGTTLVKAFHSLCVFKAGERDRASRMLDAEIARDPNEAIFHTMKAAFMVDSGRDEDARGALRVTEQGRESRLSKILHARVCSRMRDDACAEKKWKALLEEQMPPLAAFVELARLKAHQSDTNGALALTSRALSLSPRYIPALRFRREAGLQ